MTLTARIESALSAVRNPRTGVDVVAAELVRDIATTTDGRVRFTLLLDPADDAVLVRDVRQAVERVEGVSDVRVDVKDPAQSQTAASSLGSPAPTQSQAPQMPHSHGPPSGL